MLGIVSELFHFTVNNLFCSVYHCCHHSFVFWLNKDFGCSFVGVFGGVGVTPQLTVKMFVFFCVCVYKMVSTNVGKAMFGTAALGTSLWFISWNIKGMGHPVKRSKVLTHLKQLKSSIVFLQETHLQIEDHHGLHCSWVGQVFYSEFNSKSRGVAILINKKV